MRVSVRRTPRSAQLDGATARSAARRRRGDELRAAVARPPNGVVRVEAPMVGTFYRAPQPGAPPFVEEGDAVAPGQTLCILEAMKLMNEVKAERRGHRPRDPRRERASRSSSASSCSSSSRSTAARSTRSSDVRPRPRRQPRRDRRPRDPRAARARHRGRRRLLDRRRGRAPRPPRRPGRLHRPAAGGRELPAASRRSSPPRDDRLRGRPSRLRLPRREPGLRRGLRGQRPRLRRPERRRDGADGRQGRRRRQEMRAAGVPLVPGHRRRDDARRGARRPRTRSATRCCSRRRPAAAARGCGSSTTPDELEDAFATAVRRGARRRSATATLYLEKAVVPARHVEIQVLVRRPRRRAHARRARVLDPAPPPEADRGVAVAGARRPSCARRWRPRPSAPAARSATANAGTFEFLLGAGRLVLLHRAERAAPGRAPGHRARTGIDLVREQLRIAAGEPLTRDRPRAARAATRSRSGSTPRTRRAASCRRPGRIDALPRRRSARASGSTRTSRTAPRSRRTTTRCSRS